MSLRSSKSLDLASSPRDDSHVLGDLGCCDWRGHLPKSSCPLHSSCHSLGGRIALGVDPDVGLDADLDVGHYAHVSGKSRRQCTEALVKFTRLINPTGGMLILKSRCKCVSTERRPKLGVRRLKD